MRFMRAATEMMHTGIVSESFYLTKTVTLITNSNSCFFFLLIIGQIDRKFGRFFIRNGVRLIAEGLGFKNKYNCKLNVNAN